MRAFLGIELTEELREQLGRLRMRITECDPSWRQDKWVSVQNLHITVKFLGDCEARDLARLTAGLHEETPSLSAFDLRVLDPVIPVPDARRATMLWTTLDDTDGAALRLARVADEACVRIGIPPEARTYRPHITLVRARRPHGFACTPDDVSKCLDPRTFVSVAAVTLFSSTLSRGGPVYEVLERVSLNPR